MADVCSVCFRLDGDSLWSCASCGVSCHRRCQRKDEMGTDIEENSLCDRCFYQKEASPVAHLAALHCFLCEGPGQGGTRDRDWLVMKRTKEGEWVHLLCAQNDVAVSWVNDKKCELSLNRDVLEKRKEAASFCEICSTSDGVGVMPCSDCGKSFFHPICAKLRGFRSGYSTSRCPSCAQCAEKEIFRNRFKDILLDAKLSSRNEETLATLIKLIDQGQFDRTPFQGGVELLKTIESKTDSRLPGVLQSLSEMPGVRSCSELKSFLNVLDKIRGEKQFPKALLGLVRNVIAKEREDEIRDEMDSCNVGEKDLAVMEKLEKRILFGFVDEDNIRATLSKDAPEVSRVNKKVLPETKEEVLMDKLERRLLFGFVDAVQVYFDAHGLLRTMTRTLSCKEHATVQLCQRVVRVTVKSVQDSFLSLQQERAGRQLIQRLYYPYQEQSDDGDEADGMGFIDVDNFASNLRPFAHRVSTAVKRKSFAAKKQAKKPDANSSVTENVTEDLLGDEMQAPAEVSQEIAPLMCKVRHALDENAQNEPYLAGAWNRAPYPKRPYEELSDYVPAEGLCAKQQEELMQILRTSKEPECSPSDPCDTPVPFSVHRNTFLTELPCKSRRVACSKSDLGQGKGLQLGKEVEEANMWGFDCFTKKNITSVLEIVCGITRTATQRTFLQQLLLPVVAAQLAYRAHNLAHSCTSILSVCGKPNDGTSEFSPVCGEFEVDYARSNQGVQDKVNAIVQRVLALGDSLLSRENIRLASAALLYTIRKWGVNNFRVHPKGVGVQCLAEKGLPSGTFVTKYIGELYPCWRWFEKTDAIKNVQKAVNFKPILPDFYNIQLERHEDDQDGYDIAFIDPIIRGNFASRLSHSCEPNCATVVMTVNGRYVVTVYTLRDVEFGEELTFDYSSVTEDENEFRAATCLCGSLACRGSFLFYAGSGAFADVLNDFHQFVDRNALIVRACESPDLFQQDIERLDRHGLKSAALHDLPVWMKKWASLVLEYAEFEREELAHRLCLQAFPNGSLIYDETSARIEANGVLENRKQNVVITLNKLRYFLTAKREGKAANQTFLLPDNLSCSPPPLSVLSEQQVVNFLWNDADSIAATALEKGIAAAEEADKPRFQSLQSLWRSTKHSDVSSMRASLRLVRDLFWSLRDSKRASFIAVGDLLTWFLHTDCFFTSQSYPGVRSEPVLVRNVDIGRDGSVIDSIRGKVGGSTGSATSSKGVNGVKRPRAGSESFVKTKKSKFSSKAKSTDDDGSADAHLENRAPRPPRKRGPAMLPFWYEPQADGSVLLLNTNASNLATVTCEMRGGVCQSMAVSNLSEDTRASAKEFALLVVPMPGTLPLYIFNRGSQCRVSPDEPRRPVKGEHEEPWRLEGLYYVFDFQLPGTEQVDCLDDEGALFTFYTFAKQAFKDKKIRFGSGGRKEETPSSDQVVKLPRAIDPRAPVFSDSKDSKAKLYTKKYQSGFVWGQMCGWFKQTVASPDASLSAERRGTLSLPDLESCFGNVKYSDREQIMDRVLNSPSVLWPTGTHWSFKNKRKIYGSPWFDAAIKPDSLNCFNAVREMQRHKSQPKK